MKRKEMEKESLPLLGAAKVPAIGLGTWKSEPGKILEAVKTAVRAGVRLIDCANDYGNEKEIGVALKELFDAGEIRRDELFIQAKLWNTNHRPEHVRKDLEATLADLQLEYVDAFMIHWPQACPSQGKLTLATNGNFAGPAADNTMFPLQADGRYCVDKESHYVETWAAMEDLVDSGLTKFIGLSNFNRSQIAEVLRNVKKHRPAMLQNESHPYLQNKDLVDFCRIHSIVFQAYSPLGSFDRPWAKSGSITSGAPPTGHELLQDPVIKQMATAHSKSPAQIVLRWHVQRGTSAVAKSVTPSRIKENCALFDFELTANEMASFDRLNIGWRHLLWEATAGHPDYPFKDDLPHNFEVPPASSNTGKSGQ